ncbi:MAG: Rhodanese-like domain-containing protein [Monoraphidium minutum]|nr:MAG: Rhodanese-like domain-containing protein [Monoraphidium minutum]
MAFSMGSRTISGPSRGAPAVAPARAPPRARASAAARAVRVSGPQEVAALVDSGAWPYLDVRTPEEFADGHIEGAVNVPIMLKSAMGMAPNAEFIDQVKGLFPEATGQVVMGCKSGRRSAAAAAALQGHFDEIVDLDGGYDAWVAAGLPVKMCD